MKKITLKNAEVLVEEKYVDNILSTAMKPSFDQMTLEEFNIALSVEKLCSGETIELPGGKKLRFAN